LHISYYAARGYGQTRSWYWVSESMLLVLLGAVVSSIIFEKLRQLTRRNTLNITLLFAAAGLLMFLHTRYLYHQFPYSIPAEKEIEYIVQVRSLEQETPEGALIGMTGGGETAYFIQNRTIVNLDGLISSVAYFEAMKNGTADEFLERMGLDYVFGKPYTLLESFLNRFRRKVAISAMVVVRRDQGLLPLPGVNPSRLRSVSFFL